MKLSFHGAAQTVTGSKHLLSTDNGETLLLDCGMFQGLGKEGFLWNKDWGFDPKSVDYLVLTHAHIDHSGLIPKLVADGFSGKIFCTKATYDLCVIMLADSAHIQEADAYFNNKRKRERGEELYQPLYNSADVRAALGLFCPLDYKDECKLSDFLKLTFYNNGHILGSASAVLRVMDGSVWKSICFTGDIGRCDTILLKDPEPFPQVDVLICESTYGDRLHESLDHASKQLLEIVIEAIRVKKGKLIIPAFSLGRTQELIFTLNKLDLFGCLPGVKIYVDSPLAVSATEITRKHENLLNSSVKKLAAVRNDPFGFDELIYIREKEESQRLNDLNEPCIIISASGMADAGRVKHHIYNNIENPNNTILLVGYAEPRSLAGRLRQQPEEVRIFGDMKRVRASIKSIDAYSAHADYQEMINYLSCQNPSEIQKVFLVHGTIDAQKHFKEQLKEKGFNHIYIPEKGEEHYL